jgi:hypothetical protein
VLQFLLLVSCLEFRVLGYVLDAISSFFPICLVMFYLAFFLI